MKTSFQTGSLPGFSPASAHLRNFTRLLGLYLLISGAAAGGVEFYVSPKGKDSNPGTRSKPFATIARAQTAVRAVNSKDAAAQGVKVFLRGGDYLCDQTLEFGAADSGIEKSPVIWSAYKGEKPRLLGGRLLGNPSPVTDAAILKRLPAPAREFVQQWDLRALGILEFGEMQSRGFARTAKAAHSELFYAGKPMTVARWPNEGDWAKIAGFPSDSAQGDSHGGQFGALEKGFLYAGDRPRQWQDPSDAWVHGYWSWDWANSYERVTAIDLETRLVRTAPPHGNYGFRKDQRFYFLNILEEIDQPGEWFLDRKSGRLYFWPIAGQGTEAIFSTLAGPFFRFKDARNVRLEGLTLEATRGTAIEIDGGSAIQIAGCTIRNVGVYGVKVNGGNGHGVVSCDVLDTGDGGVELNGGDRKTLTPARHFVENCHFQRQGRWSKCYVPAIHMTGVGHRASNNLIQDHPHCAILYWGNDHLMEFNEIHHIALETGDVGAIYTGRDYTFRGNRVCHNFIHRTGGVGMGSMGVYMDDCVSGTEIYGNIFYQVQRAAFLGGGRDHPVINNIFVDCNHAVELDGRGLDKSPVWYDMVDKTMRDRLKDVPLDLYRERYPAMRSLDAYYGAPGAKAITGEAFKGVPPENNVVKNNVSIGKWLHVYWHAKAEMLVLENNFTNAVAQFSRLPAEPTTPSDFRLKPDASAFAAGFQPIPYEKIGLYRDRFRKALPAPWAPLTFAPLVKEGDL